MMTQLSLAAAFLRPVTSMVNVCGPLVRPVAVNTTGSITGETE